MAEFPPPLTVGLFGTDPEFLRVLGSAIGKTGTESDLRFWNKKDRDLSLTAITPTTYPERITPMLQVAALCDYPVLDASRLDAAFGEMAIVLGSLAKPGLLILRGAETADRARALMKDRLHGWVHMDWAGDESARRFRELLPGILVPRDPAGPCTVVLDHAFSVRGVGTVALGFVRRGTLRVHDELRLAPLDENVLVRSIQRFDEDRMEAPPGSRVGIALKGVEADEIERGFVLTADERVLSRPVVAVRPYRRIEYAKDAVEAGGRGFHLAAGAYVRPVVLNEVGASLEATADRAVPLVQGDVAFLTALRGAGSLRVLGWGPVVP